LNYSNSFEIRRLQAAGLYQNTTGAETYSPRNSTFRTTMSGI
jgi:hypothetical protein